MLVYSWFSIHYVNKKYFDLILFNLPTVSCFERNRIGGICIACYSGGTGIESAVFISLVIVVEPALNRLYLCSLLFVIEPLLIT